MLGLVWGLMGGLTAGAQELATTGLAASDAKILLLPNETPVPLDSVLKDGTQYRIDYKWSIPDGVQINQGDTATVHLPQNDTPHETMSGYVTATVAGKPNVVVGTLRVFADSFAAKITFNDALKHTNTNRQGTISISARGHGSATSGQESTTPSAGTGTATGPSGAGSSSDTGSGAYDLNKVGWGIESTPVNAVAAAPTKIVWNVIFDGRGDDLGDTEILDELGPYQTYIPGSFVMNDYSRQVAYTIQADGSNVRFNFAKVAQPVGFTFTTRVSPLTGYGERYNTAIMTTTHSFPAGRDTGKAGNTHQATVLAAVNWGLKAAFNGDYFGRVQLTKYAADASAGTEKTLAGAKYNLYSTHDSSFSQQYVTEADGRLTAPGLRAGDYYFKEVQAPTGYAINSARESFSIAPQNGNQAVTVSQVDQRLSHSSSSSSSVASGGSDVSSQPSNSAGQTTSTVPDGSSATDSSTETSETTASSAGSKPADVSVSSQPVKTPESTTSSSQAVTTVQESTSTTPTSTATREVKVKTRPVRHADTVVATMTAQKKPKAGAISRLPQTDEQKAAVVFWGLSLLGGVLSYQAWRRHQS